MIKNLEMNDDFAILQTAVNHSTHALNSVSLDIEILMLRMDELKEELLFVEYALQILQKQRIFCEVSLESDLLALDLLMMELELSDNVQFRHDSFVFEKNRARCQRIAMKVKKKSEEMDILWQLSWDFVGKQAHSKQRAS